MSKLELVGGTDTEDTPTPILKPDWTQDSPHWLNNYPLGTFILVKKNNTRDPILGEFCIQQRKGKNNATRLVMPNGEGVWVDPRDFSIAWNLFEVLITAEEYLAFAKETADEGTEE